MEDLFNSLLSLLQRIQPPVCVVGVEANQNGDTANRVSPGRSSNSTPGVSEVVPEVETANRTSPGRRNSNSIPGDCEVVPGEEPANRISPQKERDTNSNSTARGSEIVPEEEHASRRSSDLPPVDPEDEPADRVFPGGDTGSNSTPGVSEGALEEEPASRISPQPADTGSSSTSTSTTAMCYKCKNCEYANHLDKLKRDISYIQPSLERQSKYEQQLGEYRNQLEDLINGENNGAPGGRVPLVLDPGWFKELTNAVLQFKFQLPYTSYHMFREADNSPISQSLGSDSPANDVSPTQVGDEVTRAYSTLDNDQKKCLWCFSVFDGEVKKRVLLNWWIGQGLLKPSSDSNGESMSLEQAGEMTLAKLMPNFITQVVKGTRVVDRWEMKPSVCAFLRSEAKGESIFDLEGESLEMEMKFLKSNSRIGNPDDRVKTVFNVSRSSIADSEAEKLAYMESLIVLHIGRSRNTPKWNVRLTNLKLIQNLRRMKQLRLLSLQGISSIRELPESVCELSSLMVLDLSECQALESLPRNMKNLKSLTHLDVSGCLLLLKMPFGISYLDNLEVLKGYVIRFQNCSLWGLRKLKKLHKLSIFVRRESFPTSEDLEDLCNINRLVKLKIVWRPPTLNIHPAVDRLNVPEDLGQRNDDNPPVGENEVNSYMSLYQTIQQNQEGTDQHLQVHENIGSLTHEQVIQGSSAAQYQDEQVEGPRDLFQDLQDGRDLLRNIGEFSRKMFRSCFGNQMKTEISEEVVRDRFLNLEKLDLWCAPNEMLLAPNKYPKLKKLYIRGRLKFDLLKQPGEDGVWQNVDTLRLLYLPGLQIKLADFFSPPRLFPKLSYLQYKKPEDELDYWPPPAPAPEEGDRGDVDPIHVLSGHIDAFISRYVTSVKYIIGDGHCGYRSLALLLGYRDDQQYMRVRSEVAGELRKNQSLYELALKFSIGDVNINNVALTGPGPRPNGRDTWMEAPMVPLAVATLYHKVVVVLSIQHSHTYFPILASGTNMNPPTEVIALALVDSTHWVPIWLRPGSPIPPTSPEWINYHDDSVSRWVEPFMERMQQYQESYAQWLEAGGN